MASARQIVEEESARDWLRRQRAIEPKLEIKPANGEGRPDHPVQEVRAVQGDRQVILGTVCYSDWYGESGWKITYVPDWTNIVGFSVKLFHSKEEAARHLLKLWGGLWQQEIAAGRAWR